MPLFRAQLFKRLSGADREWSNTYLIRATDLDAAVIAADPLPFREQDLHADNVNFTRMRVSDITPSTDVFTIVPLSLIGQAYTVADFEYLPLYNTVRVDIQVLLGGRPSRKYYRSPVGEQWQVNGVLDSTILTLFQTQVAGMIADVATNGGVLVDPDDQEWTTPSTLPNVQMRQLHRKRKKQVTSP